MVEFVDNTEDDRRSLPRGRSFAEEEGAFSIINEEMLRAAISEALKAEFERGASSPALDNAEGRDRAVARLMEGIGKRIDKTSLEPELQTAAEIFAQVYQTCKEVGEELDEQEIRELVRLFLRLNRNKDPLVRSAEMIVENARRRANFLSVWPAVSSKELPQMAGHSAKNPSATGNRWRSRHQAFAVSTVDGLLYPMFQFADGEPLPIIARILAQLPEEMTGWSIAFWFTSPNGHLNGELPVNCLHDADLVVRAAAAEATEIIG